MNKLIALCYAAAEGFMFLWNIQCKPLFNRYRTKIFISIIYLLCSQFAQVQINPAHSASAHSTWWIDIWNNMMQYFSALKYTPNSQHQNVPHDLRPWGGHGSEAEVTQPNPSPPCRKEEIHMHMGMLHRQILWKKKSSKWSIVIEERKWEKGLWELEASWPRGDGFNSGWEGL